MTQVKVIFPFSILFISIIIFSCTNNKATSEPLDQEKSVVEIDYTLTKDQTHNKFSSAIPPILKVKSGAVIEAFTKDASDEQFNLNSTISDLDSLNFEPIHPLTGPVYIENAKPGDVLKVTLHKIELGDWGWNAIVPGFGFLADTIKDKYLKIYNLGSDKKYIDFNDKIKIPLKPFAGVMGVAPPTKEMLSTIPPRANGGNMDDPNLTEGVIVYFPVFVEGALFSIGDAHAVQGLGEVCGTALEAPMRFVYQLDIIKGKSIKEPQYETNKYYATTGYATTIDAAAKKATLYMIDYLMNEHNLTQTEAYALCSLAGDLKIAETVDVPNMLVTMHMSKDIFNTK